MSTSPQQVPQKILLPQIATIECVQCHNKINVRLPRPRLANASDSTVIVFAHERVDKCPHCGINYLFQVDGIDQNGTLVFLWLPLQDQTSAIVPGTQSNLTQALNADDTAKKIKIN